MIQGYLNDKIKKLFITKHEVYDGKIKINALIKLKVYLYIRFADAVWD